MSIFDNYEDVFQESKKNKLCDSSFRTVNRVQFDQFDDHDDDDYDYYNYEINESSLIKSEDLSKSEHDPDDIEIKNWIPSRRAKKYLLKLDNSKNVAFLLNQIQTLAPYVDGYLIFFNFLKNLNNHLVFTEQELYQMLDSEVKNLQKNNLINFGKRNFIYFNIKKMCFTFFL
jgi:hypothetical protein